MNVIETVNLTKFYQKVCGIENVNLTVEEGDFFGFIGPNGAGKSTTIRLLLGLIYPTSGSGSVFGKDMIKDRTEILSRIGYLPSETQFHSGMKVKDVLEFSRRLRGVECKKESDLLCERLNLDPNRKVRDLSFGNRKKVGIVCALQHKPDLYILDEPTSGLDPLMQKEFYSILKERNEEGATVFLSSHVLSEVERYCKSAALIRSGKILSVDRVENLRKGGIKQVRLQNPSATPDFAGVKDLKSENGEVTFFYQGTSENLLMELQKIEFSDFTVTDPTLEEVFLHFYEKEEK